MSGWCGSAGQVVPPQDNWKIFHGCRLSRQPRHFFCWEEFTLARARQGFYAGQARPGYAGQVRRNCRVRRQFRTKTFLVPPQTGRSAIEGKYPSIQLPVLPVHMSHQTRLGRAIKRGWGEPSRWASQAVGRAKPLGEPLNHACFKAAPWYGVLCPLSTVSARHVPARHIYLVPAWHCTPTVPARHRGSYKCPLGTGVPARHVPARHCLCLLGTCPLGTVS